MANLARKLDMRSVAEGVDTREQLAAVTSSGCDDVQGYFFNRPVPASEIKNILAA